MFFSRFLKATQRPKKIAPNMRCIITGQKWARGVWSHTQSHQRFQQVISINIFGTSPILVIKFYLSRI